MGVNGEALQLQAVILQVYKSCEIIIALNYGYTWTVCMHCVYRVTITF